MATDAMWHVRRISSISADDLMSRCCWTNIVGDSVFASETLRIKLVTVSETPMRSEFLWLYHSEKGFGNLIQIINYKICV